MIWVKGGVLWRATRGRRALSPTLPLSIGIRPPSRTISNVFRLINVFGTKNLFKIDRAMGDEDRPFRTAGKEIRVKEKGSASRDQVRGAAACCGCSGVCDDMVKRRTPPMISGHF